MRLDLLSIQAAEISCIANWTAYEFEMLPKYPQESVMCKVTGAVVPLKLSGPNKGKPNYNKKDSSTVREIYIQIKDYESWIKDWEIKTGNCANCAGKGKLFHSWSKDSGSTYRPCLMCNSTGLKNHEL